MGKSESKMIFVAYCAGDFKAATTKAGLGKLIGVSVDTVRRNLGNGKLVYGIGQTWNVGEVELVKVGGSRKSNGDPRFGGFLGMKGGDGLLKSKIG